MTLFVAALVLFVLAFAGLAAGLLLGRKGPRGGCRPAAGNEHECHCKEGKPTESDAAESSSAQNEGRKD